MQASLHQPLGVHQSRGLRFRRPTGADIAICGVAAALLAASLVPAWLDRPVRVAGDQLAGRQARLASLTEEALAMPPSRSSRGGAMTIDVGAAMDERRRREMAGEVEPFRPAEIRVLEIGDVRQSPTLAHLPEDDLLEESEFGPLPIRGADGRRPFDVYAGKSSGRHGARVAIVVGGLGISQSGTQAAIAALPEAVTFAFAANGNSLDRWMQGARREGHELLLQVPMEPIGYPTVDPGENTVTVDEARTGDFASLHASLGRLTNYVGIINYMGGRITADAAAMDPLMAELAKRGLMYLDDGSSVRSIGPDIAKIASVPAAASDLVLDDIQDAGEISRRLDELESIARSKGSAIGTASAFDLSTNVIAGWIADATRRGIEIVPVSALADDPERR